MRIREINIRNAPPVDLFSANDLSDVVVVAGANGIGKTRLLERLVGHLRQASPDPNIAGVIQFTTKAEKEEWGKESLDMASSDDMSLFRETLQHSRRRQKWKSSLINFESDRTIRNLQPLQASWDMQDPSEEEVSWDITSGLMRDRFQDTVHAMYRMTEAQRLGYGARVVELGRQGKTSMNFSFVDPIAPFKEIFRQLLGPKELVDPSVRRQQLEYRLNGEVFQFESLSSGEREVVNIAFDFLLRAPEDCIVFFDEPELHLHQELSHRLIQSLQQIGERNQFFLSTHSPDVITAALEQSVVFLSPPRQNLSGEPVNQAVRVSESDDTNQALRLMGQSIGIIALGKRIVLIEGEHSSLDKQTYGSILRGRWPELVLAPSGGKHILDSFSVVYDSVLSKTLWGVEFFMLCDRDSRPPSSAEEEEAITSGRLRALPRYHLENYFLDEHVWAAAVADLVDADSWLRSPAQIREKLRHQARRLLSYATALSVSHQLRHSIGNVDVMPSGCDGKTLAELQGLLVDRAQPEADRVHKALQADLIRARTRAVFEALADSIETDTPFWVQNIPGKPLVNMFAGATGLQVAHAKNLYLAAARRMTVSPFADVEAIFADFAALNL